MSSSSVSSYFFVISEPNIVPRDLFVFVTSISIARFCPLSSALLSCVMISVISFVFESSKSYTCLGSNITLCFLPSNGLLSMQSRSIFDCLSLRLSRFFKRSPRPTSSSTVFTPSFAIYSRSSSAMKRMKFSTYSGFPAKRLRSSGFCVAIPAGHVSKLHTLIITQPIVTSGAVAKPNSSAPRHAAIATSRPLISLPSVSILTLFLRPFIRSVWCVSASPSSHGSPALWIELLGAAPVPPS